MTHTEPPVDESTQLKQVSPGGLLCALVLTPNSFSRNRFFGLFENPELKRMRHRARHVRSIFRQLAAKGPDRAEVLGRLELADRRVLLRYRVGRLSLERTTSLSALEWAVLNYALHRACGTPLSPEDRLQVESALRGLGAPSPSAPGAEGSQL